MIIKCRLLPFPTNKCGGAVGLLSEEKQEYILLFNSDYCDIRRRQAFGHEMAHLCLGHLYQIGRPIMECEDEANRMAWEYYRRFKNEYRALESGAESFEI